MTKGEIADSFDLKQKESKEIRKNKIVKKHHRK